MKSRRRTPERINALKPGPIDVIKHRGKIVLPPLVTRRLGAQTDADFLRTGMRRALPTPSRAEQILTDVITFMGYGRAINSPKFTIDSQSENLNIRMAVGNVIAVH